ncbi:MAG: hypothetical protein O2923_06755 [Verrucomicrobia bacterium]|nr:hypothetical protein [Verrucomicrobiota bacterium]MDA1088009.1 hypothetical protein [Verrucomicrobiota bacterium]
MSEQLYIGYQARMPVGIARFLRMRTLGLILIATLMAMVLVSAQKHFAISSYEFGAFHAIEGTLIEKPFPMLVMQRPGQHGRVAPVSRYFLGALGKHGTQSDVAGLDGKRVRLQGALIYRDDQATIDLKPGSIEVLDELGAGGTGSIMELGEFTLQGEIVDSKCYMGIMKPGNLKPHRACAVRCISGGIPPVLLVRDAAGRSLYFLLVGADGESVNRKILRHVALPVEIKGRVTRHGDQWILRADPGAIKPLS